MKKISFTPHFAFLADDVRQEKNNKLIFIGVYTGKVLLSKFPARMRMAVWFEFEVTLEEGQVLTLDMSLSLDGKGKAEANNRQTTAMSGEVKKGAVNVVIVFDNLEIEKPGDLIFSVRQRGGKWKDVFTKPVELNPEIANAQ